VRKRILLIEDEPGLRLALSGRLASEGHLVEQAADGETGLRRASSEPFDLVVLDVMLPDRSGFDVCRDLRKGGIDTPVLMLTARGQVEDRVLGLKLGADDYLVKPFGMAELIARIRAVLRRAAPDPTPAEVAIVLGDVRLDPRTRTATHSEEPLDLPRREFDLLHMLMTNAGTVLPRQRLMDDVWGVDWFGSTKTLDVHVAGLRRRLGDDAQESRYIHTVRGVGFRFSSREELEG